MNVILFAIENSPSMFPMLSILDLPLPSVDEYSVQEDKVNLFYSLVPTSIELVLFDTSVSIQKTPVKSERVHCLLPSCFINRCTHLIRDSHSTYI